MDSTTPPSQYVEPTRDPNWKIEVTTTQSNIAGRIINMPHYSLLNATGIIIKEGKGGREGQRYYHYQDTSNGVDLNFLASRFDADGKKPLDYYTVFLTGAEENKKIISEHPEIKEKISEALPLIPQGVWSSVPINSVKFE